jgi:hypothetical protein
MNNNQYLKYMLEKNDIPNENYFCFEQACAQDKRIVPYLYTLSKCSKKELEGFKVFYLKYLQKAEIEVPTDWDVLISSLESDPVLMVTFIAAAQYYFL